MGNDPNLNTDWIISPKELTSWSQLRDENLPAFTGSPKWRNYVAFLENTLLEYGVVDIFKNRWPFERWYTSDDAANWSLVSDGRLVRVSHYDAYSGSTGPSGITAQLLYYDHDNPPQSLKDDIIVFPTLPHPQPPFDDEYLMYSTFKKAATQFLRHSPLAYRLVHVKDVFIMTPTSSNTVHNYAGI